MKTIATIAVSLLVNLGLFASPTHAAPPRAERLTVVTAGDSITAGAGTVSRRFGWPGRLHRQNMRTMDLTNVARSASCLRFDGCGYGETLLSSFRRDVLSLHPDVAIVAIGRNDLCHISTADYKAGLRELRAEASEQGTRVMFGTITPVNDNWRFPCEDQAAEINEWLRTMPDTIDFAAALANHDGLLPHAYDSGDGLHPNGAGYRVMARTAAQALKG